MSEFCEKKGIKREFSVARTPQQNGVAERRNMTLIEAARTMYLVVISLNKTPLHCFRGGIACFTKLHRAIGSHVNILNTLRYLGQVDGKSDEGSWLILMNSLVQTLMNSCSIEESIGCSHSSKETDLPRLHIDANSERMIEAMQEELLQFKLQQVWTLVDLPLSKRAIGTKWIYRNKKDERGLQVTHKDDGIFSSEDKYVDEILKKFSFSAVKTASTPMETSKPLLKDAEAEDVDIDFMAMQEANYSTKAEYVAAASCSGQLLPRQRCQWGSAIYKLVDGKNVIVTKQGKLERMGYENLTQKLTFYKALFSPQWKFLIHTILQCLSAKTTAWNIFSSTMASAIILFLDKQVEGMTKHKEIYVTPSYTKKVFAKMKREGKGLSRRVTPLFQTMMVQALEELGEGSEIPTDPQYTPTINQPSSSQPPKKQKPRKTKK
ncbi:ribonuclease H-like domain-containing protein [Tanacetum coccineum]|uniref:Ribonuclease H-like domain-containing protein n=1 Tax=Tanacetum coccineum TaxID=301880 RepID=A0ABQ5H8J6_9ASTR